MPSLPPALSSPLCPIQLQQAACCPGPTRPASPRGSLQVRRPASHRCAARTSCPAPHILLFAPCPSRALFVPCPSCPSRASRPPHALPLMHFMHLACSSLHAACTLCSCPWHARLVRVRESSPDLLLHRRHRQHTAGIGSTPDAPAAHRRHRRHRWHTGCTRCTGGTPAALAAPAAQRRHQRHTGGRAVH